MGAQAGSQAPTFPAKQALLPGWHWLALPTLKPQLGNPKIKEERLYFYF